MKIINIITHITLILIIASMNFCYALPASNPFPPFRIIGNLYYVGDDYQADYLIATSQGHILINSGYARDVAKIKNSINKLGFQFKDIKIFLISHAHADHNGGASLIKNETHAKYMVMDADVATVETGGKADFNYGKSKDAELFYSPIKVDRILHDGDKVQLGNTTLVAHHTGGHTKGCTTWTLKVKEHNKQYDVVIVGGPYVNPGYKLVNNANYPNIAKDYEHTFKVLKSLHCDVFLGAHGGYFDLKHKYTLLNHSASNPFIDPNGYKKFRTEAEIAFRSELAKQSENTCAR